MKTIVLRRGFSSPSIVTYAMMGKIHSLNRNIQERLFTAWDIRRCQSDRRFARQLSNVGWVCPMAAMFYLAFAGMSPEWQKSMKKAFNMAQNEVRNQFNRCHNCRLWVCHDFNEEEKDYVECAPARI